MKSKLAIGYLLVLSLLLLPGTAAAAPYDDLYKSLNCPACIGHSLATCEDSTANQARADIKNKLAAGQTKDQILAEFVAQYGDVILTIPSKTGFNLMAWLIPPLVTIAATLLVYLVVTKWSRNHRGNQRNSGESIVLDEVDEDRIRKEVRKYL